MRFPLYRAWPSALMAAISLALALPLCAQRPDAAELPPPPPRSIYTLNVYANLIQLPTMVLGVADKPVLSIPQDRFRIRIDGGPWFKPTRMHVEGAEPLMLGVLLDSSGSEPLLLREAPEAFSALSAGALNPADRMIFYAFDCGVTRNTAPILTNAPTILTAVQQVLTTPGLHSSNPRQPTCFRESRLVDALAVTLIGIAGQGTRRALLVVTDGFDHQSKHSWHELMAFAHENSIAVFAIRSNTYIAAPFESAERRASIAQLESLCLSSGGLMFNTSPSDLSATLARVLSLLRSRYILEFPRPGNATGGYHHAEVKVPGRDVVIFFSGVQALLPGDDEKNGANTIQHDATNDPRQGKKSTHE